MVVQLTLFDPPPPPEGAPVWLVLEAEEREEVLGMLARLIAQAALAERSDQPPPGGNSDE